MIKYFCDHCGKEIKKLDNLREVVYGFGNKGCNKPIHEATVHAICLKKINKAMTGVLPGLKLPVDK